MPRKTYGERFIEAKGLLVEKIKSGEYESTLEVLVEAIAELQVEAQITRERQGELNKRTALLKTCGP